MKTGPQKKRDSLKIIQGTAQPCRMSGQNEDIHTNKEQVVCLLKRPTYLKGEARKVWDRIVPILTEKDRATDAYFDLILSYSLLAGRMADLAKKQELLATNDRAELRRMGETLGLIEMMGDTGQKAANKQNKFARNGRPKN